MSGRRAATVLVTAALAVGTGAAPAGATITSGYFDCGYNVVSASVPSYRFDGQSATTLWWIPQYVEWTAASGWQHWSWGEYSYNTELGAPHAWTSYATGQHLSTQSAPTRPGQFFAVRHWVHAEGGWQAAWAANSDRSTGPQPEDVWWCST